MRFKDVVQNWGDFPSPAALFASEGEYRGDDERGYLRTRTGAILSGQRRKMWEAEMVKACALIKRAMEGNDYARLMLRDAMRGGFKEAMSISDFPSLFGDIIHRSVLANYMETPYTWNQV